MDKEREREREREFCIGFCVFCSEQSSIFICICFGSAADFSSFLFFFFSFFAFDLVFAEKVILVSLRSLTFFLIFCYGFIIVGSLMMDLGGGSEG